MATIFVSPGVYTREQDFTAFASRIGVTRLGIVGKTPKGPAGEAIRVNSGDEFLLRYGATDYKYPATYVANSFLSQSNDLTVTRVLGEGGFTNGPAWIIAADFSNGSSGSKSGATLAVLRSKKSNAGVAFYDEQTDIIIGATTSGSTSASFVLSATTGPLTAQTNSSITVSLDETKNDYIAKLLGKSPAVVDGAYDFYVESVYPHFIREAKARGEIYGIHPELIYNSTSAWTDYAADYTHAVTPWIVSEVIGGDVHNLFKVHTISDGDSSNREVKISIANLDTTNNLFDLIVRRYEDNDANSFSVLERFSRLSMNPSSSRYCAKIIGTQDDDYPSRSMFIKLELAESYPADALPAGFKGYELRSMASGSTTIAPNLYYKTTYLSGDTVSKTYMGVSELGYSSITSTQVSVKNAAQNVEHDIFQYPGGTATDKTTTLGFHMESTAPASLYSTGDKATLTAYTKTNSSVIDRARLKFTVLPYGGFDGFDKYLTFDATELYSEFTDAYQSNVNAFKTAIDTMESSESVDINLITTPGIDYSNNETLVKYTLNLVEDRVDLLYIIDSPRLTVGTVKGDPETAVSDLESTGIDSSYAATYWPWIQVEDIKTGRYVYMSPTYAAVRALAFTDNKYQSWFAPAGQIRGVMPGNVIRADVKLTKAQRDTLYAGRINPIATFTQSGVQIQGQKTLQVRESALDRINVRRLMLRVQRLVAAASLTLLFEQNDQTVRDQFLAKVEPILLQIQNQRGITAFKVTMDDSNNTADTIDRNMLIGKIQIKPTRAVEFIDLTFQVLPTGARFEDF